MKLAFLYAGQGSQCAGMGRDFYEYDPDFAALIDRADPGFDLKKIMFEAPLEELSRTRYTQPVMAAYAAGVTAALYRSGLYPSYTAGLSLGEYSALHAAGVLDADTLIRVTAFRGKAMEEAAKGQDCRMCAVIGLPSEQVEKIVGQVTEERKDASDGEFVEVANYNTASQTVIAGTEGAVSRAKELLSEAGARRLRDLKVSGAFHTSMMKPVADELDRCFRHVTFFAPQVPVIFNTTAEPLADGEEIPELLKRQVCSSVRMKQTIDYLSAQGVDTVVEIGPGRTLAGLVKKTAPQMRTFSIKDVDSFRQTVEELRA